MACPGSRVMRALKLKRRLERETFLMFWAGLIGSTVCTTTALLAW